MAQPSEIRDVVGEFEGVSLGDARLDQRMLRIASLIAAAPSDSFPDAMGTEADQEALYRFFANPKVTAEKLLSGHRRATCERIVGQKRIRVVHDTSEFSFDGDRKGLGILQGFTKGFFGHFALAVGGDETREPLGVLGIRPFINDDVAARRGMTQAQKNITATRKPREEKKSRRWEEHAINVAKTLPRGVEAIHVMDQEADDMSVFSALEREGLKFVIRADPKRLTADGTPLNELLANQEAKPFRAVGISSRSRKQARTHPERKERTATLVARMGVANFVRKKTRFEPACQATLYAVHVLEPNPPAGEAPIDWMLLTNQPILTMEQLEQLVDDYRARWMIEEYFKALKTGCAFEKRQLCSLDGLLRALALLVPMAWQLLRLRHVARDEVVRPAAAVLSADQLHLLRILLEKRGRALPTSPTARDAMLGVAALGGHIKNNGDPGWIVLGRGFNRLAEAEDLWSALRRSDQS